jgi:hypothetical protein
LDDGGDFAVAVDGASCSGVVDDAVGAVVEAVAGEVAFGGDDVKPLGEEEVDLGDVLPEGGVASGVVLDVVGGAQTFAGVEGDVRWLNVSSTMGRAAELLVPGLLVGQGAIVALLRGKQEFRQRPHAEEAHKEDGTEDEATEGERVKDDPEALPALALRIVEDWFAHRR